MSWSGGRGSVGRVAEADALASVIEEARAWAAGHRAGVGGFDCVQARDVDAILYRAPFDVLVERDARIRAEVIDWIEAMGDGGSVYREAREHFGLTKGADRG